MFKSAQIHLACFDLEHLHARTDVAVVAMNYAQVFGRYHCHFVIGQVYDFLRVTGQRRAVAGYEMLSIAHPDDERTSQSGGNNHIRPIAERIVNP